MSKDNVELKPIRQKSYRIKSKLPARGREQARHAASVDDYVRTERALYPNFARPPQAELCGGHDMGERLRRKDRCKSVPRLLRRLNEYAQAGGIGELGIGSSWRDSHQRDDSELGATRSYVDRSTRESISEAVKRHGFDSVLRFPSQSALGALGTGANEPLAPLPDDGKMASPTIHTRGAQNKDIDEGESSHRKHRAHSEPPRRRTVVIKECEEDLVWTDRDSVPRPEMPDLGQIEEKIMSSPKLPKDIEGVPEQVSVNLGAGSIPGTDTQDNLSYQERGRRPRKKYKPPLQIEDITQSHSQSDLTSKQPLPWGPDESGFSGASSPRATAIADTLDKSPVLFNATSKSAEALLNVPVQTENARKQKSEATQESPCQAVCKERKGKPKKKNKSGELSVQSSPEMNTSRPQDSEFPCNIKVSEPCQKDEMPTTSCSPERARSPGAKGGRSPKKKGKRKGSQSPPDGKGKKGKGKRGKGARGTASADNMVSGSASEGGVVQPCPSSPNACGIPKTSRSKSSNDARRNKSPRGDQSADNVKRSQYPCPKRKKRPKDPWAGKCWADGKRHPDFSRNFFKSLQQAFGDQLSCIAYTNRHLMPFPGMKGLYIPDVGMGNLFYDDERGSDTDEEYYDEFDEGRGKRERRPTLSGQSSPGGTSRIQSPAGSSKGKSSGHTSKTSTATGKQRRSGQESNATPYDHEGSVVSLTSSQKPVPSETAVKNEAGDESRRSSLVPVVTPRESNITQVEVEITKSSTVFSGDKGEGVEDGDGSKTTVKELVGGSKQASIAPSQVNSIADEGSKKPSIVVTDEGMRPSKAHSEECRQESLASKSRSTVKEIKSATLTANDRGLSKQSLVTSTVGTDPCKVPSRRSTVASKKQEEEEGECNQWEADKVSIEGLDPNKVESIAITMECEQEIPYDVSSSECCIRMCAKIESPQNVICLNLKNVDQEDEECPDYITYEKLDRIEDDKEVRSRKSREKQNRSNESLKSRTCSQFNQSSASEYGGDVTPRPQSPIYSESPGSMRKSDLSHAPDDEDIEADLMPVQKAASRNRRSCRYTCDEWKKQHIGRTALSMQDDGSTDYTEAEERMDRKYSSGRFEPDEDHLERQSSQQERSGRNSSQISRKSSREQERERQDSRTRQRRGDERVSRQESVDTQGARTHDSLMSSPQTYGSRGHSSETLSATGTTRPDEEKYVSDSSKPPCTPRSDASYTRDVKRRSYDRSEVPRTPGDGYKSRDSYDRLRASPRRSGSVSAYRDTGSRDRYSIGNDSPGGSGLDDRASLRSPRRSGSVSTYRGRGSRDSYATRESQSPAEYLSQVLQEVSSPKKSGLMSSYKEQSGLRRSVDDRRCSCLAGSRTSKVSPVKTTPDNGRHDRYREYDRSYEDDRQSMQSMRKYSDPSVDKLIRSATEKQMLGSGRYPSYHEQVVRRYETCSPPKAPCDEVPDETMERRPRSTQREDTERDRGFNTRTEFGPRGTGVRVRVNPRSGDRGMDQPGVTTHRKIVVSCEESRTSASSAVPEKCHKPRGRSTSKKMKYSSHSDDTETVSSDMMELASKHSECAYGKNSDSLQSDTTSCYSDPEPAQRRQSLQRRRWRATCSDSKRPEVSETSDSSCDDEENSSTLCETASGSINENHAVEKKKRKRRKPNADEYDLSTTDSCVGIQPAKLRGRILFRQSDSKRKCSTSPISKSATVAVHNGKVRMMSSARGSRLLRSGRDEDAEACSSDTTSQTADDGSCGAQSPRQRGKNLESILSDSCMNKYEDKTRQLREKQRKLTELCRALSLQSQRKASNPPVKESTGRRSPCGRYSSQNSGTRSPTGSKYYRSARAQQLMADERIARLLRKSNQRSRSNSALSQHNSDSETEGEIDTFQQVITPEQPLPLRVERQIQSFLGEVPVWNQQAQDPEIYSHRQRNSSQNCQNGSPTRFRVSTANRAENKETFEFRMKDWSLCQTRHGSSPAKPQFPSSPNSSPHEDGNGNNYNSPIGFQPFSITSISSVPATNFTEYSLSQMEYNGKSVAEFECHAMARQQKTPLSSVDYLIQEKATPKSDRCPSPVKDHGNKNFSSNVQRNKNSSSGGGGGELLYSEYAYRCGVVDTLRLLDSDNLSIDSSTDFLPTTTTYEAGSETSMNVGTIDEHFVEMTKSVHSVTQDNQSEDDTFEKVRKNSLRALVIASELSTDWSPSHVLAENAKNSKTWMGKTVRCSPTPLDRSTFSEKHTGNEYQLGKENKQPAERDFTLRVTVDSSTSPQPPQQTVYDYAVHREKCTDADSQYITGSFTLHGQDSPVRDKAFYEESNHAYVRKEKIRTDFNNKESAVGCCSEPPKMIIDVRSAGTSPVLTHDLLTGNKEDETGFIKSQERYGVDTSIQAAYPYSEEFLTYGTKVNKSVCCTDFEIPTKDSVMPTPRKRQHNSVPEPSGAKYCSKCLFANLHETYPMEICSNNLVHLISNPCLGNGDETARSVQKYDRNESFKRLTSECASQCSSNNSIHNYEPLATPGEGSQISCSHERLRCVMCHSEICEGQGNVRRENYIPERMSGSHLSSHTQTMTQFAGHAEINRSRLSDECSSFHQEGSRKFSESLNRRGSRDLSVAHTSWDSSTYTSGITRTQAYSTAYTSKTADQQKSRISNYLGGSSGSDPKFSDVCSCENCTKGAEKSQEDDTLASTDGFEVYENSSSQHAKKPKSSENASDHAPTSDRSGNNIHHDQGKQHKESNSCTRECRKGKSPTPVANKAKSAVSLREMARFCPRCHETIAYQEKREPDEETSIFFRQRCRHESDDHICRSQKSPKFCDEYMEWDDDSAHWTDVDSAKDCDCISTNTLQQQIDKEFSPLRLFHALVDENIKVYFDKKLKAWTSPDRKRCSRLNVDINRSKDDTSNEPHEISTHHSGKTQRQSVSPSVSRSRRSNTLLEKKDEVIEKLQAVLFPPESTHDEHVSPSASFHNRRQDTCEKYHKSTRVDIEQDPISEKKILVLPSREDARSYRKVAASKSYREMLVEWIRSAIPRVISFSSKDWSKDSQSIRAITKRRSRSEPWRRRRKKINMMRKASSSGNVANRNFSNTDLTKAEFEAKDSESYYDVKKNQQSNVVTRKPPLHDKTSLPRNQRRENIKSKSPMGSPKSKRALPYKCPLVAQTSIRARQHSTPRRPAKMKQTCKTPSVSPKPKKKKTEVKQAPYEEPSPPVECKQKQKAKQMPTFSSTGLCKLANKFLPPHEENCHVHSDQLSPHWRHDTGRIGKWERDFGDDDDDDDGDMMEVYDRDEWDEFDSLAGCDAIESCILTPIQEESDSREKGSGNSGKSKSKNDFEAFVENCKNKLQSITSQNDIAGDDANKSEKTMDNTVSSTTSRFSTFPSMVTSTPAGTSRWTDADRTPYMSDKHLPVEKEAVAVMAPMELLQCENPGCSCQRDAELKIWDGEANYSSSNYAIENRVQDRALSPRGFTLQPTCQFKSSFMRQQLQMPPVDTKRKREDELLRCYTGRYSTYTPFHRISQGTPWYQNVNMSRKVADRDYMVRSTDRVYYRRALSPLRKPGVSSYASTSHTYATYYPTLHYNYMETSTYKSDFLQNLELYGEYMHGPGLVKSSTVKVEEEKGKVDNKGKKGRSAGPLTYSTTPCDLVRANRNESANNGNDSSSSSELSGHDDLEMADNAQTREFSCLPLSTANSRIANDIPGAEKDRPVPIKRVEESRKSKRIQKQVIQPMRVPSSNETYCLCCDPNYLCYDCVHSEYQLNRVPNFAAKNINGSGNMFVHTPHGQQHSALASRQDPLGDSDEDFTSAPEEVSHSSGASQRRSKRLWRHNQEIDDTCNHPDSMNCFMGDGPGGSVREGPREDFLMSISPMEEEDSTMFRSVRQRPARCERSSDLAVEQASCSYSKPGRSFSEYDPTSMNLSDHFDKGSLMSRRSCFGQGDISGKRAFTKWYAEDDEKSIGRRRAALKASVVEDKLPRKPAVAVEHGKDSGSSDDDEDDEDDEDEDDDDEEYFIGDDGIEVSEKRRKKLPQGEEEDAENDEDDDDEELDDDDDEEEEENDEDEEEDEVDGELIYEEVPGEENNDGAGDRDAETKGKSKEAGAGREGKPHELEGNIADCNNQKMTKVRKSFHEASNMKASRPKDNAQLKGVPVGAKALTTNPSSHHSTGEQQVKQKYIGLYDKHEHVKTTPRNQGKFSLEQIKVPAIEKERVRFACDENGDWAEIGRGSYGCVYLGLLDGIIEVAIKDFYESSSWDLVIHEARMLMFLQDTGITPKFYGLRRRFDISKQPSEYCIIMEYFGDGRTLFNVMSDKMTLAGDEWMDIVGQLVAGLRLIHRKNVLINDLKADNILIDLTGGRKIIRYIDVGMATYKQGLTFQLPQDQMNKYNFLAPEVREGARTTTRSDIYSLGYMLEQMCRLADSTLGGLRKLITRCMDKNPSRRPDIDDIVSQVHRFIASKANVMVKSSSPREQFLLINSV